MQSSVTEMTFPTADQCSAVFQHLQLLCACAAAAPCMWGVSCHMLVVSWQLSLKCQFTNSCYFHCCKFGSKETRQSDAWMAAASQHCRLLCLCERNWGRLEPCKEGTVFHALPSQGSPTGSSLDREEFGAVSLLLEQLSRISDPSLQLLTAPGEYLVSATVQKGTRPPFYLWPPAMGCWWAQGCAGGWETGTHLLLLLPVPSLPPPLCLLGLRSESLKYPQGNCSVSSRLLFMPELVSPHKRVCIAQVMC